MALNIQRQKVEQNGAGREQRLPLVALPQKFLDWQIESRRQLFEQLLSRKPVRFLASHLPVLATLNPEGTSNLANKGVGPIPKDAHLATYIELFKRVLSENQDRPWEQTLVARVEAASKLLRHPHHIDPYRLGSLEIFEGQTFQNIRENSRVALLYTASGPEYLSFQIDGIAQILEPGQPVYEFLHTSRLLFEHDGFHIAQSKYPYAYQFAVCGVRDKTPHRRESSRLHRR